MKLPGSHGGRRAGAGKKKGTKWPSTLAKEEVRERVRQLVTAHMQPMLLAQMQNATGIQHCFLRRADGTFERSDDPDAILRALNSGDATSYYIFTKDPSVQAFTDLMNRAIDKPKEQVQEVAMKHEGLERLVSVLDEFKRENAAKKK